MKKSNKGYREIENAVEDLIYYLKTQKEMLENSNSKEGLDYKMAKISRLESEINKYSNRYGKARRMTTKR